MRLRNLKTILLFIALIVTAGSCFGFIGLRAGIGQFVPQDSTLKDSYANFYLFEVRYYLREPVFLQAGTKIINIHNATLPIVASPDPSYSITLGAYKHRLDALGAYGGIGFGYLLGNGATGIYPYASINGGLISPVVSQRAEYYMDSDTMLSMFHVQEERRWAAMANLSAGIELKVIGIGVFIQGDYILGNSVAYDPIEIEGVELFPGGKIEIAGWAVSIGITID